MPLPMVEWCLSTLCAEQGGSPSLSRSANPAKSALPPALDSIRHQMELFSEVRARHALGKEDRTGMGGATMVHDVPSPVSTGPGTATVTAHFSGAWIGALAEVPFTLRSEHCREKRHL